MPMYNASPYLHECIDSILGQTFTDFELLIVDDGSTDDSISIIEAYNDERICLIKRHHDYIASLNFLMQKARGRYIARMDADDIMLPDRLRLQFEFLESHPEVDIVGGGMQRFDQYGIKPEKICPLFGRNITIEDMLEANRIIHASVMMRKEFIKKHKIRYRAEYKSAEDLMFWYDLLFAGAVIQNIPDVVHYYRSHKAQTSQIFNSKQNSLTKSIQNDACQKAMRQIDECLKQNEFIPISGNRLTVIIPFLNEREEVIQTVQSVRDTAGNSVDIIVINDCSINDFPYGQLLEPYGVNYIVNTIRIGAALSKEKGVRLCTTPYLILLDAHMRILTDNWVDIVLDAIEANPNRLLCCQSLPLKKLSDGTIEPENTKTSGAYLSYNKIQNIPGIRWNYNLNLSKDDIPCILGAGYVASKEYWHKLRGLEGLIHYGCEEQYLSIKAWREGGGCQILHRVIIGHIYRKNNMPYHIHGYQYVYNYIAIAKTLLPLSELSMSLSVARKLNSHYAYDAIRLLLENRSILNNELSTYYNSMLNNGMSFYNIRKINNQYALADEFGALASQYDVSKEVNYIITNAALPVEDGLICGKTAFILLYVHYYEINPSEEIENRVIELFDSIKNKLPSLYDYTVFSGVSGIGLAMIYMMANGLIEEDLSDELSIIDRKIELFSVKRITDQSFLTGIGGIYAYVVARLNNAKRNKLNENLFSNEFMMELELMAANLYSDTSDFITASFMFEFLNRHNNNKEIMPFLLFDYVDISSFIPKDRKEWTMSLTGTLGTLINLIQLKKITRNEEKLL